MNVILYGRVSTTDQSCEAQLLELRTYCAQRNWTIAHEITDTISGTKSDRDGLNRVMELVAAKAVDAVCVVKIDRIARSLHHFSSVSRTLVKHGVAIVATSQGIDTTNQNPCGKMMMGFLAVIAEFERDLISERTKAGLAVARANGKKIGRPSLLLPPPGERRRIVLEWLNGPDLGYGRLGQMLGGVERSTAWRVANELNLRPPSVDVEV